MVRLDCRNGIHYFATLAGIQTADSECQRPSTTLIERCLAARYSQLGSALRRQAEDGLALNQELARRHITGLCALSIGIRDQDERALVTASEAATAAGEALDNGNEAAFRRLSGDLFEGVRGRGRPRCPDRHSPGVQASRFAEDLAAPGDHPHHPCAHAGAQAHDARAQADAAAAPAAPDQARQRRQHLTWGRASCARRLR